MDTAQWPQEIVVKPIEEIVTNTCLKPPPPRPSPGVAAANSPSIGGGGGVERKARPHKDKALNCPRCNSTNTKFCYYNNYSLTQPRYFCKTCRRYWTEGGSLRSIPVGGGSRKNKRLSSSLPIPSPSSSSSSSKKHHLLVATPPVAPTAATTGLTDQNPKTHETQDLNLAFPQGFRTNGDICEFVQVPNSLNLGNNIKNPLVPSSSSSASVTATSTTGTSQLSALELLTGMSSSSSTFMALHSAQDPIASTVFTTSGFSINYPMQEFIRPTLSFSLDDGYGEDHLHHQEEGANTANGRLLFPFENLKLPVSSLSVTTSGDNNIDHQHSSDKEQGDNSAGFWSGMLGGGGGGGSWQL